MPNKVTKIFVDTDICLDLLSSRKPYNTHAEKLFTWADHGVIKLYVSSLSFANIDYILQSHFKLKDSRSILAKFKTLVSVLAVDNKIIDLALASNFKDFEDAIQYYTAIESKIEILLTRNLKDYKEATIQIMSPESFLASGTDR